MTYRIAHNEEFLGPYTLPEMQRHLASGHILASDLAQGDTMDEWLPISELFPELPMQNARFHAPVTQRLFPDPPDLPWWIALLLGVLMLGAFFVVWDVIEAVWLRRVERSNLPLVLYSIALALFVLNLPAQLQSISHALFNGPLVDSPFALWLSVGGLLVRLVARFMLRRDLLQHFNDVERISLKLNWLLTLLLGGLYFQFHFNRINEQKRALRVSVP